MKKFEYCIFDNSRYEDWEVYDRTNNLGKEGWELVCVTPKINKYYNAHYIYYFKRELK